jgi:hypothetical protein
MDWVTPPKKVSHTSEVLVGKIEVLEKGEHG